MKIAFLVSRFPYPLEKGDKLRAFQHIVNLKLEGHQIHLISLSDIKVTESDKSFLLPYCESINVFHLSKKTLFSNLALSFIRKLPLQVGYFFNSEIRKRIEDLVYTIRPDVVYCQLIRMALYVENINSIPAIIDYQDAFAKGTSQRMEKANGLIKPIFSRELKLVIVF
jgi:hypothetical protein